MLPPIFFSSFFATSFFVTSFLATSFFATSFIATTFASAVLSNHSAAASIGNLAASYPAVVASLKLGDAEAALKEETPPWFLASSRKGTRPYGYPLGVCQAGCPAPVEPCPGFSCPLWPYQGSSNCTRVFYPGSKATRSSTNCLPDFREDCSSSGGGAVAKSAVATNSGCVPCALWHLVSTKCAPFSAGPGGRGDTNSDDCAIVAVPGLPGAPGYQANATAIKDLTSSATTTSSSNSNTRKAPLQVAAKAAAAALAFSLGEPYAVVPSRERGSAAGQQLCLTRAQIMVVPARPCSGVDDDRAECTGSRAEALWEAAWLEALAAGFPSFPYDDDSSSNGKPTWGVVVNAANRRSQHQTHLRIAPWSRDAQQLVYFGDILQKWLSTDAFSLDPAKPTLTAPNVFPLPPDPSRPGETQSPLIATVFVPLSFSLSSSSSDSDNKKSDNLKGMGWARPWSTASIVAAAVDNRTSAATVAAKELSVPIRASFVAPFVPGSVYGRPYGILVAPWSQKAAAAAAAGASAAKISRGFAVAALFDVGSTQLLDEAPTGGSCFSRCAQWDNPGERPALPLDYATEWGRKKEQG